MKRKPAWLRKFRLTPRGLVGAVSLNQPTAMPRINPLAKLAKEHPQHPDLAAAAQVVVKAKRPAKAGSKGHLDRITKILADVGDGTVIFLATQEATKALLSSRNAVLPSGKPDAAKLKADLLVWWMDHPEISDWREAWAEWRKGPAQPAEIGSREPKPSEKPVEKPAPVKPEPVPPPAKPADLPPEFALLYPSALRTKSMPSRLRQVIARRGQLTEFEAAIRGQGDFAVKYLMESYMPLVIEVLPPHMNPLGLPSVAVSHTFIQNGDVMFDPEIVFTVLGKDEWMPTEITQHPVGVYRAAFAGGEQTPLPQARAIVRDILPLANLWARNLHEQGWTSFVPPQPKQPDPTRPTLGEALEKPLGEALRKIIPFPKAGSIEEMESIAMPE